MDADGPHRFQNVPFGRDVVQAPGGASGLSHSETRCAAFAGAGASSASTTCRFRESIPHPVQPLSTLRTPRCRDARKTRSRRLHFPFLRTDSTRGWRSGSGQSSATADRTIAATRGKMRRFGEKKRRIGAGWNEDCDFFHQRIRNAGLGSGRGPNTRPGDAEARRIRSRSPVCPP